MGALGALSVDMTQANSTLPDDSQHDGQSVRFLYNKSLNESGTNIQLVGYRYSTSGYFNFADTTYSRMNGYNIETQDGVIRLSRNSPTITTSLITNAGNYSSPLLSNSGAHQHCI